MAKKQIKWMTVTEYLNEYNEKNDCKITRKDVYKLINTGELEANKNERGHYMIKLITEPEVEYTVKEYVEKHNKKSKNPRITIKAVREMAAKGEIKAKKVSGKWVILESPK